MRWWTRQQLNSPNPERRRAALERLVLRASSGLEGAALQALSDSDPLVRLGAVEALTQLTPERALVCLTKAAGHPDPILRERSVRALACFRGHSVVETLRRALRDSGDGVRTAAARALTTLGWRPESEAEQAAWAVARHDFNGAARFGASALESLLLAVADSSNADRRGAVLALAQIADTRATDAIISAARDPDPNVKVAALEALGDLEEAAAADAARAALRDGNANVRAAAAESLGRMADAGSLHPLSKAIKDVNWEVRKAAAEALGKLRDERALAPLVSGLTDSDPDVRLASVEALGRLGFEGATEPLIGSLIDEHAPVRRAADGALRRIDVRWEHSLAAQAALPRLKAALNANDYLVRQSAADVLMRIGAGTTAQPHPSALSRAAAHRRQASVEVFTACLANPDRDVRLAAVEALGRVLEPATRAALERVAGDAEEDEWVRDAARTVVPRLAAVRRHPEASPRAEPGEGKIVALSLWDREPKAAETLSGRGA